MRLSHFQAGRYLALLAGGCFFSQLLPAATAADPIFKTEPTIRPEESSDAEPSAGSKQAWISPEYIHYWQNGTPTLPVLLTQAPAEGTNGAAVPGGGGGVSNAYGPKRLHFDGDGVRLTAGGWIDKKQTYGFEVSGFYIPKQTQTTTINSDGGVAIAAPYTDFNPLSPGPQTVPFSGEFNNSSPIPVNPTSGSATFRATTQEYGGEANFLVHAFRERPVSGLSVEGNAFGGIRYFGLKDEFDDSYTGQLFSGAGGVVQFGTSDEFHTNNNFYGLNLGAHFRADYHHFFAELTPKIGLGAMDESVEVEGSAFSTTNEIVGGYNHGTSGNPGGLYATGNKLGTRSQTKFAYIPQITAKLGYSFTDWAEVFIAYDALYISELARAEAQIDTNIDSSTGALGNRYPTYPATGGGVLGAPDNSPAPGVVSSSMFEQGVTAGLTFRL